MLNKIILLLFANFVKKIKSKILVVRLEKEEEKMEVLNDIFITFILLSFYYFVIK
jgi:hypothetical protein